MQPRKIALVFPFNQQRKHWYSHSTKKDNICIPIQPKKITFVFPFNQQRVILMLYIFGCTVVPMLYIFGCTVILMLYIFDCTVMEHTNVIFVGWMGIQMLSLLVDWEYQCYRCFYYHSTKKDNIGIPIHPTKITLEFPCNQERYIFLVVQ
jgi:hypothetical protein